MAARLCNLLKMCDRTLMVSFLREHEMVHMEEKQFKCKLCNKTFEHL